MKKRRPHGTGFLVDRPYCAGTNVAGCYCGHADRCRHKSDGKLRRFHQSQKNGRPSDIQTFRPQSVYPGRPGRPATAAQGFTRRSHRLARGGTRAYAFAHVLRLRHEGLQG